MTQLSPPRYAVADPCAQPTPWRRTRSMVLGGLAAVLLTVAVHFRDPHRHASWGLCPLYALTGLYCPGCGGMRAVNDLTNGDLRAAVSSNVLALTLLPVVIGWWLVEVRNRWRGVHVVPFTRRHASTATTLAAIVAIGFMVVRNTPWGAGFAP
ncbi:DUF2752 domain-containing protein [Dermatophilaceae bacterium Sec6.4]